MMESAKNELKMDASELALEEALRFLYSGKVR